MNKEKLKLIVQNLESLVECLKSEVYSDIKKITQYIEDYDEVFYDDESAEPADLIRVNQKYKITNDDDGDGL